MGRNNQNLEPAARCVPTKNCVWRVIQQPPITNGTSSTRYRPRKTNNYKPPAWQPHPGCQDGAAGGCALTMKKKKPITIKLATTTAATRCWTLNSASAANTKRRLLYGKFACPTCQTLNWTTCRAIAQWVARKTPWSCERCRTTARKKSAKSSTASYADNRAKTTCPCAAIRSPRAAHPTAAASVSVTASHARKRPTGRRYIRVKALLDKQPDDVRNGQFKSPRST